MKKLVLLGALVSVCTSVHAASCRPDLDAAKAAEVVAALDNGARVCRNEYQAMGGSQIKRRPCVDGRYINASYRTRIHEEYATTVKTVAEADPNAPICEQGPPPSHFGPLVHFYSVGTSHVTLAHRGH